MTDAVRYTCVTCGVCCKNRLVPLTVSEAEQWLARGHDVAIITEAFEVVPEHEMTARYRHDLGRSASAAAGDADINVIAVFAGNALNECPNLKPDNLCGIYQERPLVCRIYPLEINPFISLDTSKKICPPESWGVGEIIYKDGQVSASTSAMIDLSRESDIVEASMKVEITASLGLNVASWKYDGIVVYFPIRKALLYAIQHRNKNLHALRTQWSVRTDTPELHAQLKAKGITLAKVDDLYIYQELE